MFVMIKFVFIYVFLLFNVFADSLRNFDQSILEARLTSSWEDWHHQLEAGDIILAPLQCWSCFYIEDETGYPFSHTAIVLDILDKDVLLAQSLGPAHTIFLSQWMTHMREGEYVVALRPKWRSDQTFLSHHELRSSVFNQRFQRYFEGLPFDVNFLWGNYNDRGQRMLYCSEFIVEFLNPFLEYPIKPFEMDFSRNLEFWQEYFEIPVPQGFPGFSPGDFLRIEGMGLKVWDVI